MFTRPMSWVFLLFVMVGLSFLKKKTAMRNLFLFGASIFFYLKHDATTFFKEELLQANGHLLLALPTAPGMWSIGYETRVFGVMLSSS